MKKYFPFTFLILFVTSACKDNSSGNDTDVSVNIVPEPANINYNIVATYPHDTSSFTEGLQWINNALYESTGLERESRLIKVNINSGKADKSIALDPALFGEGLTVLKGKLYQLTWKNHKAFVYDLNTFKKLKEFVWDKEGWGMTTNGTDLIITTSDSNLYFVDPETFKVKNIVGVTDNNGPLASINELEYVDGMVYANVWMRDDIVKIDPSNGRVVGKVNLAGLLKRSNKPYNPETVDVLNGIAYNPDKKSFYITGKKWPVLFEMKLN